MFRRSAHRFLDYKTTPKVSEAFGNVIKRNGEFDHVAIDVGSITAQAGRILRDLLGPERDAACISYTQKTIFGSLLRRVQPKKSLILLFDGSDPLWKYRRSRLFPGKRFEGRFYRGAASPMVYALEDKLRSSVVDMRVLPREFLVSGPATVGPVEGKLCQWMLDLASRSDVSRNDSVCLLGGTDLIMSALGATPFHNISTISLNQGEFKSMSLQETMEWLGLEKVMSSSTDSPEAATRLGNVRTDVTFLLLMANGITATDLAPLAGLTFKELMDAYIDMVTKETDKLHFLTTDDGAEGTTRLHCGALEKLLSRALRKTGVARACSVSSDCLELLLQSHSMLCTGGIRNFRFAPTKSEPVVADKPRVPRIEDFIGHLKFLASKGEGTISPSIDDSFALTAAESLLVAAPNAQLIQQIFPLFSAGHGLPQSVVDDIIATKDVEEVLVKTKAVFDVMDRTDDVAHRATVHNPTHYFGRKVTSKGPPVGFEYKSVNLGIMSQARETRRKAEGKSEEMVIDASTVSKNVLAAFDTEANSWKEGPCTSESGSESSPSTLTLLTWNVQFDRHSGERTPLGRAGIDWCSSTRYVALAHILAKSNADIIGMQEVEPEWWQFLSEQSWVQQNYRLTCLKDGAAIHPWGVLCLVHKRLRVLRTSVENVPGFTGHTSVMPTIVIDIGNGVPLSVSTFHLLAPYTDNHVSNRVTQVQNLIKRLHPRTVGVDAIAMGDFNDYPTQFLVLPEELKFKDSWLQVHPPESSQAKDEGYTINGNRSAYCGLIIEPQFYGRADRILYSSKKLQPISAELVGTEAVVDMVKHDDGMSLPQNATCPEYLFPSDHFGCLVEFQVM